MEIFTRGDEVVDNAESPFLMTSILSKNISNHSSICYGQVMYSACVQQFLTSSFVDQFHVRDCTKFMGKCTGFQDF